MSDKPSQPLGLSSATALVVASMVGSAIFISAGYSLAALGSRGWVLVCWVVGGIVALCGAVSYGALAQQLRESGGEYVYLARRVHPLAGFLAGWVSLLAGFTGALALAAGTFEQYAAPLLGIAEPNGKIAIVLILLCVVQHSLGVAGGAWLQNGVVVLKVAGLSLLALLGCWWLGGREPLPATPPPTFTWSVFAVQLTYVYMAYSGFNAAVYVSEEVRDAERNVPRSMVLGTLLVTVLYLALNAVFVFSGPIEDLAGQDDIAALAMGILGGPTAEVCTRLLICAALATSVSALTMSGPRVYSKMAADGLFPIPVPPAGRSPRVAITLQSVLACTVVLVASLRAQLEYLGLILMLCAAAAVATLFWVRPDPERQPRWWQLTAAGVFVAAALALMVLTAMRKPDDGTATITACVVTIAAGVAMYFLLRWIDRVRHEDIEQ
ncbi:APC family permease [Aeoliella sp.]|uniref:APC family permease n=1 Tax=Aeoliella sp. TaxID=2795800 RepID=UPI003CCBD25C